jgi:hypothetical protein
MKTCWICGNAANSGEHMMKASDLRARFGHVAGNVPLYMHTPQRRNIPVKGIKSKLLHSQAPMCADCNGKRTQPYDFAWQELSTYLGRKRLKVRDTIPLLDVYAGTVRKSLLDLHLYFVKALGCKLVEGGANFDAAGFAAALLGRHAHPNVFIAICPPFRQKVKTLSTTHIEALDDKLIGRTVFAVWLYSLDFVNVRVVYAEPNFRDRNALIGAWHPDTAPSRLRVAPAGGSALNS